MNKKLIRHFASSCIACALFISIVLAQTPSNQSADPEREKIETIIKQGWQEIDQFLKAGGKEGDADYPGRKLAATLWEYRAQNPGTAASTHATAEAFHFLIHAGQYGEFIAKADLLNPDDAAWKSVIHMLLESAQRQKEYDYLIAKSGFMLEKSSDKDVRMNAQFNIAQGLWKKGKTESARGAFRRVIADFPDTQLARESEGNIHELDSLNLGQPAPLFVNRGLNGEPVALADFKGKVVLLNFWASWCGGCVREFPLLKEIDTKYRSQGLAIIGISIDEEAKAFQDAVSKYGLTWPQIRDGKDGQIAKLFNVRSTPESFILSREGRIAVKGIPAAKMKEAVAELFKGGTAATAEHDRRDRSQKPDEVLRLMNVRPGQVIVDIGAGQGYFTGRFAAQVGPTGKAIGVEIDASAVRAMTADAKRRNLTNYEARLVPPDDPILAPQSADIIFLCDAYHHIDDRVAYFAKVKQALKPGGKLVILDYVKSSENARHSIVREEAIEELRRAGYRLAREFDLLLPRQYFLEFEIDSEARQ
jgi:arsenite methyltransferase